MSTDIIIAHKKSNNAIHLSPLYLFLPWLKFVFLRMLFLKVYGTKSILIINRTTYLYYFMSHTRKVIEHVPPKPFIIYALPVL